MKKYAILFVVVLAFMNLHGCKSVKQTNAMKDCNYTFSSISSLKVGNISIQGKQSFRDLGVTETAGISQLLMARKLPISLVANVSINNPNNKTASLQSLDWILVIREKEIATGTIDEKIEIKPNQTVTVPIQIETDISAVLKAFSIKELTQLMFNISSISGTPIEAKLKVKPSIMVGKKEIKSPTFFTIDVPTIH